MWCTEHRKALVFLSHGCTVVYQMHYSYMCSQNYHTYNNPHTIGNSYSNDVQDRTNSTLLLFFFLLADRESC